MRIEFDPGPHRYRLDGQAVPSVTEILKPLVDYSRVPRSVLETARIRGEQTHLAVHLDNQGTLDESSLTEDIAERLECWRRFLRESKATVLGSEIRVGSTRYRYAGTLDTLVEWRRRIGLLDLKATAEIPDAVGPQTAAYATAYTETYGTPIKQRWVVQLQPDAYGFRVLDDPADWGDFLACQRIHHRKEQRK